MTAFSATEGTRKATAYELPLAHLMDDLCRREARRRFARINLQSAHELCY